MPRVATDLWEHWGEAIHVFGFSPDDPTPISAAVAASAAVPLLYWLATASGPASRM